MFGQLLHFSLFGISRHFREDCWENSVVVVLLCCFRLFITEQGSQRHAELSTCFFMASPYVGVIEFFYSYCMELIFPVCFCAARMSVVCMEFRNLF